MGAITTSIFDLFKVGPGPSSSHTIGPMKAAFDFLSRTSALDRSVLDQAAAIDIFLYGSLSATGKGHGTDRALVAGLLGWTPEGCDPAAFSQLLTRPDDCYTVRIHDRTFVISAQHIHFVRGQHDFPFSNTLIVRLTGVEGTLYEEEYYSVGGGFIQRKGEDAVISSREPPYPYGTMGELKEHLARHQLGLAELIVRNEIALTGQSRAQIDRRIDAIFGFMHRAVERGLTTEGTLPGFIHLQRKAPGLLRAARTLPEGSDSFLVLLNAYCLAASEENAAGHIVVTAPTSGVLRCHSRRQLSAQKTLPLQRRKTARGAPRRRCRRLSGQAQRQHLRRRDGLHGRDRHRLGDGGSDAHPRRRTPRRGGGGRR